MTDVTWEVNDIVVDSITGVSPTIQLGRTVTLTFQFYDSTVVQSSQNRYEQMLELIRYNGDTVTSAGTSYRGEPWYREDVPDDAPVDSFVVSVSPSIEIPDVTGFWGVVLDGEDNTEPPENFRAVNLEIFILAELDEYDRQTLENDLAEPAF